MNIQCERVYDYLKRSRKARESVILVDRIWPRGIAKDKLDYDDWAKDLAPSNELRRWFGHDTDRWDEFRTRYLAELEEHREDHERLQKLAANGPLTLLFSARDQEHNQAIILREWLEGGAPKHSK